MVFFKPTIHSKPPACLADLLFIPPRSTAPRGFQSYSYTLDSAGAGGCSMSLSMVRTHGKRKKSYVQDVLKSISLSVCVCVRLSLSLSYSHRHKKIFRHKKNTDLPHKKKLLQHTWQSKSMTLLSRWGSCIGNTPAPWASPAARRSRYYQRSPTHGDPSSLPPRNWKKKILFPTWTIMEDLPIFLFMSQIYGNLGGR